MHNGVKLQLIYHLYCKDESHIEIGGGNVYNELNRRCLEHYHDVFDSSLFCICVDDPSNLSLIHKAVDWIWSCGFRENVTIKVKPNSPFCDAKTFFDEVVDHLKDFGSMVFFGHNKGSVNTFKGETGVKKWIVYSYFSILDQTELHLKELSNTTVACTYLPISDLPTRANLKNGCYAPGTFFMLNPLKIYNFIKNNNLETPKLADRFSAEWFLPALFNFELSNEQIICRMMFDKLTNAYFYSEDQVSYYHANHDELISYFLLQERVQEYKDFFNKISEGLIFEE